MFFNKINIIFVIISSVLANTAFAAGEECNTAKSSMTVKAIVRNYTQGFLAVDNNLIETCEVNISGISDTKFDAKSIFPLNQSHYICNALVQSFRHQYATELKICDISKDTNPKYRVVRVKDVSTFLDW